MRLAIPTLVLFLLLLTGISNKAVAATLQITQLRDIELGNVPTDIQRVRRRMRFCVSMAPGGPFQLTAYTDGSLDRFALTNQGQPGAHIGFRLFAGNNPNRRGRELTPGVPRGGLQARNPRPDGSCRPPFTQLTFLLDTQDLKAAASGRYRATLRLTVAPE